MKNPMDMTGSRILVTGASSGIGQATAILLAELGCQVVLAARNEDRLRDTFAKLHGHGHLLKVIDLAEVRCIEPWLKEIAATAGPLNGFVHSAGINRTTPIRFEKPNTDDPLWRINYHAATALLMAFRKPSIRASTASVVFVSSIAGLTGQPGISAYCASKGALNAFARAAALEMAPEHIRVNCVAPGLVHIMLSSVADNKLSDAQNKGIEDAHPLGLGKPEDVANAIAFLLAETGRWITGTTLVVDGGYTAR
jgi:NAD(P)-dependent dehydrogenase (short-subunit alcohol dehydrogenase family)